jgi:2-dehydro-3-deoxyphosphogluconate aldolase/(4S)-4-hydroxy-2-oxoglutarate aldolase
MSTAAVAVPGDLDVLRAIGDTRVVAIFRTASADGVLEACRALRDGGIRAVEITLTIPGAVPLIESVVDELGDSLVVGAGTVLDVASCRTAISAGATFIVLPGFAADVVDECARQEVVCAPGALTPSEVMTALRAGVDLVKVFPARVATPDYLADLLGPFPGARLMPTGGISRLLAAEFIRKGAFAVGVGGRLVDGDVVRARDVAAISQAAVDLLAEVAAAGASA